MTESFFEFRSRLTQRVERVPAAAPSSAQSGSSAKPLTVAQLTLQIARALRERLPATFLVKGEMSNFSHHRASGHFYFTLKDRDACIDCVMYQSEAARVKFQPRDGMELLASGSVKVFAPRGRYQLYVSSLQPIGQGALELAFQQLRGKLESQGLFDPERKKPLPEFPLRIALVTAAHGAALHDMLKVLRRYPWLKLMVYPVPVQGDAAAPAIAAALRHLNRRASDVGGVDVIILGRGGGSLEDLWAFNEEIVARAIAASAIPIVTGVGHEVDVSIADLVADYHAHTPTEAAQVVTANWRGVGDAIDELRIRLNRVVRERVAHARHRIDSLFRHEFFRRPMDQVNMLRQLVDDRHRELIVTMNRRVWDLQRDLREIEEALCAHSPQILVARLAQRLVGHEQRLKYAAAVQFERRKGRVEAMERELRALSPDSVLKRGFSMTTLKKDGRVVRSANQIKGGEKLVTRLADGSIESLADDPKQPKLF